MKNRRARKTGNQRYLGGPPKFWSMCCSIGPPKTMFCCIFKKKFLGCVVLWDQIFLEKSVKNSIHFRKCFQKINVLRFKMVLIGKILKNFDEITHKTPHRLFFGKFSKIFENLTPKIHILLHFQERNYGRVFCSIGKKAGFVLLGPPPPIPLVQNLR